METLKVLGPGWGTSRRRQAWRSWEALQLTRAGHAWRKLTAERRVAGRAERCCGATLPGASRETVVRDWVLPWLQGGFRHVYRSGRQPRSIKKRSTLRRLPALPLHLAVETLWASSLMPRATTSSLLTHHLIVARRRPWQLRAYGDALSPESTLSALQPASPSKSRATWIYSRRRGADRDPTQ